MIITAPADMIVISPGVGDCWSAITPSVRAHESETPLCACLGDI
jgi:hypothetical protein